jgi:signal transduction histidine kinase
MTSTSDDATRPIAPGPPGDLRPTHPSVGADATTVAPALLGGRAFALAPFTPATWRAVSQAVIGWVWLSTAGLTALTVVPTSVALIPVFGIGLPLLVGSLVVARWFARAEIGRLALQTGAVVPPADPRRAAHPGWWSAFVAPLRDGRAWTAVAYAVLSVFTSTIVTVLALALAGGGLAGVLAPLYGVGPVLRDAVGWPPAALTVALVVVGVLALWLAALVAQGGSLLHVRMARGLLGRTRAAQELAVAERARAQAEVRTAHVEATRTQAVGAADDERRRIERDLHDGAQQRLVALGVELGAARRRSAADPEAAAVAIDHAHREVQETLAELRDLVRGIHPAVLTDRGLDAALSALAARTPVPVTVDAPEDDALRACGAAAQAAAYFVVAEALTNVTKHAGATSARVQVRCVDGRLRLVVHDDGRGGAAASPGSGLDGLRSRVAALDGTFDLVSPAGAGTTLTVEVPCAS